MDEVTSKTVFHLGSVNKRKYICEYDINHSHLLRFWRILTKFSAFSNASRKLPWLTDSNLKNILSYATLPKNLCLQKS